MENDDNNVLWYYKGIGAVRAIHNNCKYRFLSFLTKYHRNGKFTEIEVQEQVWYKTFAIHALFLLIYVLNDILGRLPPMKSILFHRH